MAPIVQEEIFGPVVALLSVSSLEEAITVANGTPYGLCAAIFTGDRNRGRRFARAWTRAGSASTCRPRWATCGYRAVAARTAGGASTRGRATGSRSSPT
ncbi:aldehyde dehydrogenase family protein [Streptomyces sp. NPDC059477]|uniref:aldehyde dehydrogenase family protein n=1 Tax=Streptomyces sp. NPDC059477 TaxID=3346847 RepID=UPI0036CA812A